MTTGRNSRQQATHDGTGKGIETLRPPGSLQMKVLDDTGGRQWGGLKASHVKLEYTFLGEDLSKRAGTERGRGTH